MRKVLFVANLLLSLALLAGCAAPTPIWLSIEPRGIQYTSDFEFSEVFRDDQAYYYAFATAPDGTEIYAVRRPLGEPGSREAPQFEDAIVRMYGLQEEVIQTEEFLKFDDLKDPGLWDPEVDLSGIILLAFGDGPSRGLLSFADNGDVFILATAWRSIDDVYAHADPQPPPEGTSLIVLHPDGTLQKVVSLRELVEAGILEPEPAEQRPSFAMVASASDRLWLKVVTWPRVQPRVIAAQAHFFQIQDPNQDGDWSDQTVQPLSLPASFTSGDPSTGEEPPWFGRQMVAEPSLAGEDRTGSFLLAVANTAGEYRIFRIADNNRDGDALDAGELEPIFTAKFPSQGFEPNLTPRLVVRDGNVALRELLASGLTRSTRLSRITEAGEVIDIARGFPFVNELATDFEGNVYVSTQTPGTDEVNPTFLIYRLRPLEEGERAAPEGTAVAPEPFPTQEVAAATVTPGVPRIAFWIESDKSENFLIGVDGSGPQKLLAGDHNYGFCQSADGSRMGFWSDEEVPHEEFVYVANADGSNPRKVTEQPVSAFWCNFAAESMPLVQNLGRTSILIRHDLQNGQETTLLTGGDQLVISPDGGSFLFVSGLDLTRFPPTGAESLEVLDIATGERRLLDGPLAEGSYTGLQWSLDGKLVAYFVGPSPYRAEGPSPSDRYDLYVREVSGGEAKLVYQFEGSAPSVYWLPSGRSMLALVDGIELLQIDAETGEAQVVASEESGITFFSWYPHLAPKEDSFAYATSQSIFIGSTDRPLQEIATAPEGECPWCGMDSFGWSLDGRYIGLWDWFSKVAVLDTTTGEIRVLVEAAEDEYVGGAGWWR